MSTRPSLVQMLVLVGLSMALGAMLLADIRAVLP